MAILVAAYVFFIAVAIESFSIVTFAVVAAVVVTVSIGMFAAAVVSIYSADKKGGK